MRPPGWWGQEDIAVAHDARTARHQTITTIRSTKGIPSRSSARDELAAPPEHVGQKIARRPNFRLKQQWDFVIDLRHG